MKKKHDTHLPSRDILSELLINNTADGHQIAITGHFRAVVNPQVIFKVLAVKKRVFTCTSKTNNVQQIIKRSDSPKFQ